ncbi:root hair defective 3 GTP-binding protein, RHD3 domain-containing protein [Theileria equi strain WA]|uniref:Protein SEY1 homolog n=1 Tax=Theileria equi strain WA TaxID=1537102 RepID=L0B0M7_THEEQ|nr:root hair defective 3 GTP-binding protein, RHD3 domain-containing protein [Theileria equi strain WA]AFZ81382.1 root hair defective 3 GTP-binding protein, RHD3 domain-containing protein [Theileria equi strain WA]|eukprot:XP_004831048.1 root hair defective 3 GTP-binding protein, RHD3 domain-containing protein [Theileria equi strain WA]
MGSFTEETGSVLPVEFISYECEVNQDFKKYLSNHNFEHFGFNYNVVTILGSQSSGKSFFLNSLFGLHFQVMDAKLGHSQTTKGIWAAFVTNDAKAGNKCSLVIDVEGTDSRERGEGRLTFEHRSSLLSLALSDCVIINLWYNSLGNLTSSNYGLLRTVVEANLELLNSTENEDHPKTILLFCVRDWFEEIAPIGMELIHIYIYISAETVKSYVLTKYMTSIWNEISKPEKFKDLSFDSIFNIEIFGLPNAIAKPEIFKSEVESIRNLWETKIRPKSYSRRVPSDGFFLYANNLWKTIMEQDHLDIPSQKEMLSNYRCNEIKNVAIEAVSYEIAQLLSQSQKEVIPDFRISATDVILKAIDTYLLQASRYEKKISSSVANEMIVTLCEKMQPIFDANVGHFTKGLVIKARKLLGDEFMVQTEDKDLQISGKNPLEVWPKFLAKCQKIHENLQGELEGYSREYTLEHTYQDLKIQYTFDIGGVTDYLGVCIKNEIDLERARHLELLKSHLESLCNFSFKNVSSTLLQRNITGEIFSGIINGIIEQNCDNAEKYSESYKGIVGEIKDNEFLCFIRIVVLNNAEENLQRIESAIVDTVVARFESFFQYQEYNGESVPRDWTKASEDILKGSFADSRKDALSIVQAVKDYKPVNISIPQCTIDADHLLYRDFQVKRERISSLPDNIEEKCKSKFYELYRYAQTLQTAGSSLSGWKNVPPLFWLILLILGWNELRAIFRTVFKIQIVLPLLVAFFFLVNWVSTSFLATARFITYLRAILLFQVYCSNPRPDSANVNVHYLMDREHCHP